MRVGIDARPLMGAESGIGRYVRELCLRLPGVLPEARFFLYCPRPLSTRWAGPWTVRTGPSLASHLPWPLWLKWYGSHLCAEDKLDVFWATRTLAPSLPRSVRTVVTVYDLNHHLVPDTMPWVNRWAHRVWFDDSVRRASTVLAISHGTSRRLEEWTGRSADAVVWPAVSNRYRRLPDKVSAPVALQYGLRKPYLLAIAALEPRKNLSVLLEAFECLRASSELASLTLALVGPTGWKSQELRRRLGQMSADVRYVGYVPEEHLPALYNSAEAFVFPSLYEGFGLPVLEARACGTRIVASDLPELREAGGDAAVYVSPTVAGVVEGVRQVLRCPRPEPGPLHTWGTSAQRLAAALTAVAS